MASRPERVVVAGLTEQDILLALGYEPVGVTEWFGDQPYAAWPWARKWLGQAKPAVLKLDDTFDYARIKALRPDLIIAVNAGLSRSEWQRLQAIAPTLGPPQSGSTSFPPWEWQTSMVAGILGKTNDGDRLIAQVRENHARVAQSHPDLAGKTATFAGPRFRDGVIDAYPAGPSTEFLSMLGLGVNQALEPVPMFESEPVEVDVEQVDVLDADVAVFATEDAGDVAELSRVPGFSELDVVRGRRTIFADETLAAALLFRTPLSLQYVLEHLPQRLEQAVEGEAPAAPVG